MVFTVAGIEIEKIARKKSSIVLFLILVLFQIILSVAGYKIRVKNLELGTGFQVAAFSIQYVLQILTLIILAISSMTVSSELSSGTVKTVLARNIKRRDFIIGKFIALISVSLIILFIIYILGLVTGYFSGGLKPLMDGDYMMCSTKSLIGGYGISLLMFIPPLVALISFGVFISTIIRGAGSAVGTGIISFLVLQMMAQMDKIDTWFFTRYLALPIANYYKMTEGILLSQTSAIYWNIGVSSLTAICFLTFSVVLFSRKDLWR